MMGSKIARTKGAKKGVPKRAALANRSAECPPSAQSTFPIPRQEQDSPSQFWAKFAVAEKAIKASSSGKILERAVLVSQNTTSPLPAECKKAPEIYEYYSVVNDEETLREFMTVIDMVDDYDIDIFADTEGDDGLGKDFNLNCIKIKMVSQDRRWLLDPMALGKELFDTPAKTGNKRTLRQILEDVKIPLVFFDVRADSNAIHGHFGVHLGCVIDLQVMEMVTRSRRLTRRNSLNRCIEALPAKYLSWAARHAFFRRKIAGKVLCSGPDGYGAFNQRPLPRILEEYAINDVENMPELFNYLSLDRGVCNDPEKMQLTLDVSKKMVDLSISPEFESQDPSNKYAPKSLTDLLPHNPYDDDWEFY